ncbi:MAG: class I adenylate-forming enzyme family protein [bacterium]
MTENQNLGAVFDPELGGDKLGLIDCRDWEAPVEYTHREIDDLANGCARGLLRRGLVRGESVAILSANRAEFLVAYLGILRAGLVAVPVNHKFPPPIVDFILADSAVKYFFCDGPRREALTTEIPFTNFDLAGDGGFAALRDAGSFDPVAPGEEEIAMVLYTSGSTGRPKGVPLSHAGHRWALEQRMKRGWPLAHHRLLFAAPLYHMNALCTSLFGLAASASAVLLPEFNARRYLRAIERFGCTWVTSVPTMLAMALLEEDLMAELDFSTVSVVRMGSAPTSAKLFARVKAAFPKARINVAYGTTEAGPVVFGPTDGRAVPDQSVGWPVAGVDVRLMDDKGAESDQGVLWQRTPATTRGYLNLPDKTAEALTPDGWYKSDDVFRRGPDGAYFFVGRSDDMFNSSGENIYPGEVEGVLLGHPNIEQSCVVPVADEIKGALPIAFVVKKPGSSVTAEEVKQFALAHAPPYQHPRMVVFVDRFPLAGPGKVDRNVLLARAAELWRGSEEQKRRAH